MSAYNRDPECLGNMQVPKRGMHGTLKKENILRVLQACGEERESWKREEEKERRGGKHARAGKLSRKRNREIP